MATKSLIITVCCIAAAIVLSRLFTPAPTKQRTELLIAAAASLKDSMDVIAARYEQEHPGIKLNFTYGSSGTLQKQIMQGAPVDAFLSAGKAQMDGLLQGKWIVKSDILLMNNLVLIVPAGSESRTASIDDLLKDDIRKIAIGQPESVPAGQYAKETLVNSGLWDKISSKLVYAKDVRQVLAYVESGNADAGFVYATDAKGASGAAAVGTIAPNLHDPIVYPAAVLTASAHQQEAQRFLRELSGTRARQVFLSFGFLPPSDGGGHP
jgi:molybdate transport system substrate-binding protein